MSDAYPTLFVKREILFIVLYTSSFLRKIGETVTKIFVSMEMPATLKNYTGFDVIT